MLHSCASRKLLVSGSERLARCRRSFGAPEQRLLRNCALLLGWKSPHLPLLGSWKVTNVATVMVRVCSLLLSAASSRLDYALCSGKLRPVSPTLKVPAEICVLCRRLFVVSCSPTCCFGTGSPDFPRPSCRCVCPGSGTAATTCQRCSCTEPCKVHTCRRCGYLAFALTLQPASPLATLHLRSSFSHQQSFKLIGAAIS